MDQKSETKDREAMARTTSSIKRGTSKAPANGHPTIAPRPNHIIPCAVFRPFFQSKKEAKPSMDIYMVKVDGKKAVEAWNMPGLSVTIITNKRPMRGLRVRQMAEYNRV
jgi:hypothetical protein